MEPPNEQLLHLLDLQVKKLEDLKKHMGNLSGLLEDQSKKIEQIRYSAAIPM